MAFSKVSTHPPSVAWESLVLRSIEASEVLGRKFAQGNHKLFKQFLQTSSCLDDFLFEAADSMMVWFFQRRDAFLSQETVTKWSRNVLDDYILLPAANGFVSREECFFVSHFWRTQEHPDPDGECLRLLQADLRLQHWSYIWLDWTCIPQSPRSQAEEAYFLRSLATMSGIIRNSGFIWFYPPFEARLWILYEIAEFTLTSSGFIPATPDIMEFMEHVQEMVQTGVRSVLNKYNYRCTYDRDKAFIISWLELLVLLRNLRIGIVYIRRAMDHMTWFPRVEELYIRMDDGLFHLSKFQGTINYKGERYTFTPFPEMCKFPYLRACTLLIVSKGRWEILWQIQPLKWCIS